MKISIISALAALAITSFTTYSHADCRNSQTGPKGPIDNCPEYRRYGSEEQQSGRITLHGMEGISRNGVLRLTAASE